MGFIELNKADFPSKNYYTSVVSTFTVLCISNGFIYKQTNKGKNLRMQKISAN